MEKQEELFAECIEIKGARIHNLKNIDLQLERDKLIVFTGLSGSGKSSLAFDTLYAEGQRRYVESLSSYARQFLGRLNKPEADSIKGIPPAIAVEQKTVVSNPRSTVGTSTEIYDYLKLLFARTGDTISPVSGEKVRKHSVTDVVDYLLNFPENTRALILSPVTPLPGRNLREQLQIIKEQGFQRVEFEGKIERTEELSTSVSPKKTGNLSIVIDRISTESSEDNLSRIADSVQTAFYESRGTCVLKIYTPEGEICKQFSDKFEMDGIQFIQPEVHLFSFNNPIGACPLCEGFGQTIGIDQDLVIPDKSLSVYNNAVACWRGEKMSLYQQEFIEQAALCDFPVHTPYARLSEKEKDILWYGNENCDGIYHFFRLLEKETRKIQYRVMLSRYRGKTKCPDCKGKRLRKEAEYVQIAQKTLPDLVDMPVSHLMRFFKDLNLPKDKQETSERLLEEIQIRLEYLNDVGLGYLTLNRNSSTLSGGESQRINLVTSLGSSLVGSLYVLDEPSIGLHARDTERLIKVLKQLRDLGNTIIVVEHDEDIIKAADYVVDIGPLSGINGGEIVFQGNIHDLPQNMPLDKHHSLTLDYIQGKKEIDIPAQNRLFNKKIILKGVTHHNLKMIDLEFPLNVFTVVSGVSGSGKSSLVSEVLYPALRRKLEEYGVKPGDFSALEGDLSAIDAVEFVGQKAMGISSRSNPVTYVKAFDEIRKLFARKKLAKAQNFTPSHFSFNTDGGRCDACKGEGFITVEMQFMADVHLPCEICEGKRFKEEVLRVTHNELSIFDILELTVEEALKFFSEDPNTLRIAELIRPLDDVGLGYIKLGQSSGTLSGGESQRLKLASFLGKEKEKKRTLFIFDEPTTGLHFHDIKKLLTAFNALLDRGHSIIVIEHNLDVIKTADYLIDLGPEGGEGGGHLLFSGTPQNIVHCSESYTGQYLKDKF